MGFILVVIQLLFPTLKYTSFPNLVLEDTTKISVVWRMVGGRVVMTGFKNK